MFKDSNIILFLLCIAPVILYSIIICFHSPTFSIRLKTSFTYLYTGLLSVTLLQFIFFIFPHVQDTFFKDNLLSFDANGDHFEVYRQTFLSLLLFAFVQVALMEELSKWIAFKCTDFIRGNRRKNLDHPYAIMFYSALISAAFAIVENIQYAQRAMVGDFGFTSPESVLSIRAVTSVVIHMVCGLFMGYYMAKGKHETKTKRIIYNIIGILAATFIHGIYDMNWMKPGSENDYYNILGVLNLHVSSTIIILFSIVMSCYMSWQIKYENKRVIKQ